MNVQKTEQDFNQLLKEIEEEQVLLPDFQRQFEWTEPERQIKLIATVLCKMPLGSILLLPAKANDFAVKRIGRNCEMIDTSQKAEEVYFLLDGQQRMTVLTNAFSDYIHLQVEAPTTIRSLKRRFFLKLPKEGKEFYERNYFGFNHFRFQIGENKVDPKENIPDYMTKELAELIVGYEFKNEDKKPYMPAKKIEIDDLKNFCTGQEDAYLIPLFLLGRTEKRTKQQNNQSVLRHIFKAIKQDRIMKILGRMTVREDDDQRAVYLREILGEEEKVKEVLEEIEQWDHSASLEEFLEDQGEEWVANMKIYLERCLEHMDLHLMFAPDSSREKAIEVFENLNRGGVKLNTFDLLVARVAQVNKTFYQDFQKSMEKPGNYNIEALGDLKLQYEKFQKEGYCAVQEMECYDKNQKVSRVYRETFLNILGLYCRNTGFEPEKVKLEYTKDKTILDLTAQEINDNFQKVCQALDRALFFMKTRCGIRSIQEINYKLMLTVTGYLFLNEEWYQQKAVHDAIEAWYWSAVFSGHYATDPNRKMEGDIRYFIEMFSGKEEKKTSWLKQMEEKILDEPGFSSFDVLIYKEKDGVKKDVKEFLGDCICQFYLSKGYMDMFERDKRIQVFMDDVEKLEKHHVIPLGSVKSMKDSNKNLRKAKNIYNSPLNYVYITQESNLKIGKMSVAVYVKEISNAAYSELGFESFSECVEVENAQVVETALAKRYKRIKGDLQGQVDKLLDYWK